MNVFAEGTRVVHYNRILKQLHWGSSQIKENPKRPWGKAIMRRLQGVRQGSHGISLYCRVAYPSYLNSRLLGYVTTGYIEPRTHDLGNWSPRLVHSRSNMNKARRHPLTRLRPYVETILSKHYQGKKNGSFLHKYKESHEPKSIKDP